MSGPLEGTVRAITDDPLSVGRDAANHVVIGAVSRKHCTISQVFHDVEALQRQCGNVYSTLWHVTAFNEIGPSDCGR
jgi:hypothetical protein